MDNKLCPHCHKLNDIHKFCIYCGHKLFDEEEIKPIRDNPKPYCLNCGRKVNKGQKKCECGYEFGDINCHRCNVKNSYANRFCISCGNKLWTSDVYKYKYSQRLFEEHFINERLPPSLKNTSLYLRPKNKIGKDHLKDFARNYVTNLKDFQLEDSKVDKNLCEIASRWKIVSPNYCINCLEVTTSEEDVCPKCGYRLSADRARVIALQNKERYINPKFSNVNLKWTPKYRFYSDSLSPAIGESQFEYRERLKWEFAENKYLKKVIKNKIKKLEGEKQAEEYFKQIRKQRGKRSATGKGRNCDYNCRYFREDYFDDIMDVNHENYRCLLGNPQIYYRSYCEDYE